MAEQGYDWESPMRYRRAPGWDVHAVETQSYELVLVVSKLVMQLDKNGMVSGTGQDQAMHCNGERVATKWWKTVRR
ncbi:unnamed protein product [Linum trigynum]|uniref:Uncharacterized protein n=1 Tax=Linum trigynum TaxID=586398 RepID=A0AAV2GPK4_9ROSI